MPSVLRILDANANRAREALRVLEEAARFVLDDAELAGALKTTRHELAALLARVDAALPARDVEGDVGTSLETATERERGSVHDVVRAAGHRLGEALRALEEYGKLVDGALAAGAEALRYRGYALEQRVRQALPRPEPAAWRVAVLLTERLCRRPWRDVAEAVLDGGASCVQLREPGLDDRSLLARAEALVGLVAGRASVIVNDRPDVALLAGADGVHLGRDDLPVAATRRLAGRRLIVGASTARLEEARAALAAGADYCGVGPMFPSTTKPKDVIAGPAYLREHVAWGGLPHLAIGGVSPENVGELVAAGARAVAVSAAACGADDPASVVRALRVALEAGAP